MIDEKVLIERLGEFSSKAEQNMNYYKDLSEEDASCEVFVDASEKEYKAFQKSIDIVNQLAEEHSHCMLCYLGSPCEYQNENAIFPVELLKDENGWIPCEVRLPECHLVRDIFKRPQGYMSDHVLVTVESVECDGVHYYVGTDMMSGSSEDNVEWLMSCGYGGTAVREQKIIAWQPKPIAYRKEEVG